MVVHLEILKSQSTKCFEENARGKLQSLIQFRSRILGRYVFNTWSKESVSVIIKIVHEQKEYGLLLFWQGSSLSYIISVIYVYWKSLPIISYDPMVFFEMYRS